MAIINGYKTLDPNRDSKRHVFSKLENTSWAPDSSLLKEHHRQAKPKQKKMDRTSKGLSLGTGTSL